ncbi:MAG: hypothetical protein U0800_24110 [Isosphaeraceae bacterium]
MEGEPLIVEESDRAVLVRFPHEQLLEEDDILATGEQLHHLAENGDGRPLVLVLDSFQYYRSMFLATLLRVRDKRIAVGGRLLIVQSAESFSQQTFAVTGVTRRFEIFPDEGSALASV